MSAQGVGSRGQQWPLFTVHQSPVLTQVPAGGHKSLVPLAPTSGGAQEVAQCDFKGCEMGFTQCVFILQRQRKH